MASVAVVGGSFAGNKGAASMVQAVIHEVRDRWPRSDIQVLSPLASEDRRFVDRRSGVDLIPFGPREILSAVFVALLYRASGARWGSANAAVRTLVASDVVVDVSGISFVDGRGGITLTYNVLLMAVPLLLGRPVVKVAQALGPFDGAMNRWAAGRILPRMRGIGARGDQTAEHLERLGLDNWAPAHDVAFLMRVTREEDRWARDTVAGRTTAVVSPSMVVEEHPDARDYTALMVKVVEYLAERYEVLLVPHAARPGRDAGRLNDLPLCERILGTVECRERCRIIGQDASPGALRALIGRADVLVTSRFHAMISGLAAGTPVLVVGWSHKYREVLDAFGLSEWAIDFRRATVDRVLEDLDRLLQAEQEIRTSIREHLPRVTAEAAVNIDLIQRALEGEDA